MLVIARGLMAKPRLLVLDEPSLGLAPVLVVEIFRLIARLRDEGGVSIVLSEQNAKLSLAIADRAYVIETGRVALAGTGRELLSSPEWPSAISASATRLHRRRAQARAAGGPAEGDFRQSHGCGVIVRPSTSLRSARDEDHCTTSLILSGARSA